MLKLTPMIYKGLKNFPSSFVRLCLLVACIALLLVLSLTVPHRSSPASTLKSNGVSSINNGTWLSEGSRWYYETDAGRVVDSWVEDFTYYVGEDGCMLKDEWIYMETDTGKIGHAESISMEEFFSINTDTLCYVGSDGRKLRNKKIYYTPFSFDNEGYCSLSNEDLEPESFPGQDVGIEHLHRYVIFNGSWKEYY